MTLHAGAYIGTDSERYFHDAFFRVFAAVESAEPFLEGLDLEREEDRGALVQKLVEWRREGSVESPDSVDELFKEQ